MPSVELVGAQEEDRVVELARHRERPPRRAGGLDRLHRRRRRLWGRAHGDRRRAQRSVEAHVDVLVVVARVVDPARERRQGHAARPLRAVGQRGELLRALADGRGERLRLRVSVDQPPLQRACCAHALGQRAEDVGMVTAHAALVGDARQAAGPWQHAQQRHFGQAHRRAAVVDQPDLVAGECQLVAAAGGGAVAGGDELEAGVRRGVLDAVARLVGELAEVHLPGVRREAEHEDVGAGAEDPVARARHDDAAHLGVLEAEPLQRVVELDVDAQVVAVQLELVAGRDAAVLVDAEDERRDRAVERRAASARTCRGARRRSPWSPRARSPRRRPPQPWGSP